MIKIDGSYGEGGGQILRSTLTLSAILGKSVEIFNIRAGRKKPGLQPQHLTGVRAVAEICNGKLEGDDLLSQRIVLHPGKIQSGSYEFDVMKVKSSAGSTGMIFQQIAPVLAFGNKNSNVVLKGGTHTDWAPPIDYLQDIFLPTAAKMGFHASLDIERWGWFPIGQGIVKAKIQPVQGKLRAIELTDRGKLKRISGLSLVSRLPLSIAERERDKALQRLKDVGHWTLDIETKSVPSLGTGNYFCLIAEFENSIAGFSSLGKIGKRAEKVADEAADQLIKYYKSKACIEKHLANQLILYMALAEGKSLFSSEISNHVLTNIWVVEQFLPVKFVIKGKPGEVGSVSVKGLGSKPSSAK
ncbi:MAG: RNA 3'-terminal phosphate cyclase [Candidatus Margulisiibacteriota bacterium]